MATYLEIRELFNDGDLRNKVTSALVISAYALIDAPSPEATAADKAYAQAVFNSPQGMGNQVLMAVLAANKDSSVATITGATDGTIQSNVDAVVPALVDALAGV